MNQNKPAVVKKLQERFRNVSVGRGLYIAFVMPTMATGALMSPTACQQGESIPGVAHLLHPTAAGEPLS